MSEKKLNKMHPDCAEFRVKCNEIIEELIKEERKIDKEYGWEKLKTGRHNIEGLKAPIRKKAFKAIDELKKKYDYLYEEVDDS